MMQNCIRKEDKQRRRARRAAPRYAKRHEQLAETQQPDSLASHKELCAKARYVVNHLLRADDRKVLWWFYKDDLSVAKIANQLGISEVAALQRLSRARRRLREAFGP
jgi:RNA polymerase sigma factor (sigma-70 family)